MEKAFRKKTLSIMTGKTIILMVILFLLSFCSGTEKQKNNTLKDKPIETYFDIFLTAETLEKTGFEHFGKYDYFFLFHGDHLFVLNDKDNLLVKYRGREPIKIFKANEGQAPGEMLVPRSLFIYKNGSLAVHDAKKQSVLLFDFELRYIDEIKLDISYVYVFNDCERMIATLDFGGDAVFALLDEDFRIQKTFGEANKKIPAERFPPPMLNVGYHLCTNLMAHTYVCYPWKECKLDLYDINKRKSVQKIVWEQPFSPKPKDFRIIRNLYFSLYMRKHGDYIVHQTYTMERIGGEKIYYLRIFDQKGKFLRQVIFPYPLIQVRDENSNSEVYFLDDDENISCMDIVKILL